MSRACLLGAVVALGAGVAPAAAQTEALVSTGSPTTPFSQNKQNEPGLAVDPTNNAILVSGSNDNVDQEACAAGDPTTCPFTPGVGVSGVYFSFDSGKTWSQPTYDGWSARGCLGPLACAPGVGPIGTVPWYYENGLVSDGDPSLAFGPVPGPNGTFSWSNGTRLYYGNLTHSFSAQRTEAAFAGSEAVAISRTDNVVGAAGGDKNAWMAPVIVSKQNTRLFADKDQLWADNASSSRYFGRVYTCYGGFRSSSKGRASPQPLFVSTSSDGGSTWTTQQVTPATNNPANAFGHTACAIRTDSAGSVYVFYEQFANGTPGVGSIDYVRSTDGGADWSRPQFVTTSVDSCNYVDPVVGRCMMDGVAGARSDLSPAPSVDIANGAPDGSGASNEIVLTWVDGGAGLNNEKVMFTYSSDGGKTWAPAADLTRTGDRGYYAATAISPQGGTAYLTYLSWMSPFQTDTSTARPLENVVLTSPLDSTGAPSGWSELDRSPPGDARGSAQNGLTGEFLGDYVSAIATPSYAATAWTDVRNAADCPAIDAWRESNEVSGSVPAPSPATDCLANFGNSDIYSFTTAP